MSDYLTDLLTQAMHSFFEDINTCAPGTVLTYDGARAVCQVSLNKLAADGRICEAPQVVSVPVLFMSGKGWSVTGPLVKGDGVLLLFSQRSLEAWHDKGDGTPDDPRMFSLSDAMAIPGLNPLNYMAQKLPAYDAVNVSLQFNDAFIKLTPDGKILTKGTWQHTGSITATEEITGADLIFGSTKVSEHTHKVTAAPGETGVPE